MQASYTTQSDGSVALRLDPEAARAVFASVMFAARFHEGITPLLEVAKKGLSEQRLKQRGGMVSCR